MKPIKRSIYAVQTGTYAGELWLFCGSSKEDYEFLAVPVMENRKISFEIFSNGIDNGALAFVEKAPRYVAKIAKKQYKKNEALNN